MALKDGKRTGARIPGADGSTLVAHVQQRREGERARLARMLHHDVSGMLAAARMDLSRVMAHVVDPELQEPLRRVDQLLDQVIHAARREMQWLHPALLDHFGLPLAIRHLVDETCRGKGVRFAMSLDETLEDVAPEVQIAAFRLVEALLGDCRGLAEFGTRLVARRDGYVLEITLTRDAASNDDAPALADLEALRTWLRARGVAWADSAQANRSRVELRIPRRSPAPVRSATPGG